MNHFSGLMAAPFTPFDTKGQLKPEVIPAYVNKLITDGIQGIFVCGSNGEGPNMSSVERMLTAQAFKEAAGSKLKVFVHVGHSSIVESQRLAEHAAKIGADAISCVASFYFKPDSEEILVRSLAEIAAVNPEMPFYYYHIPHLTGVRMDMVKFLELSENTIANMTGIKYTASSLWEYQACLNYAKGKFDLLYGLDEMMLSALSLGAKGLIGSTYNFAAPLYLDLISTFTKGEIKEARKKMLYLVDMIRIVLRFPAISAQKTIMKQLGFDLGPCRLPLVTLSRDDESSLYRQLEEIDFFEKVTSATLENKIHTVTTNGL